MSPIFIQFISAVCVFYRNESSVQEMSVVLLADTGLLQLPLEALGFLHEGTVHTVSRDLSLQMLHHRISKFISDDSG